MNSLTIAPQATDTIRRNEQDFCLSVFDRSLRQVAVHDVVMIEGDGNYTLFYTSSGRKIMVSRTLKEYETLLDSHSFVRIHKSYLINLYHLKEYDDRVEEVAVLKNGLKVEVARRRKKEFQYRAEPFLRRKAD
jgi:two-component system LytT family response regulator